MDKMFYEKDVPRILKENDLWYDWSVHTDGTIDIFVEWGDWKHDHAYLEYLMNKNHYRQISERLTEEDGSDCYSSVHTFVYGA